MKEVTSKILSERLKELEIEGLVINRIDAGAFPVKSEYKLTEMGVELVEVIKEIKTWALKRKIDNCVCKNQDCRVCTLEADTQYDIALSSFLLVTFYSVA
jgi:Predicted transcriptional regulators